MFPILPIRNETSRARRANIGADGVIQRRYCACISNTTASLILGYPSMSPFGRSKIILPLASALALFALSAHAEDPPQQPVGRGAVRASKPAPDTRPGRWPAEGRRMPIEGRLMRAWPAAPCRRAISADTPIAAVSPGRADAGITRCTMDVRAGGGTSEGSGIITRNRWKVRRPMSRRITPMMSDPMGLPSPALTPRHRLAPMHHRRRNLRLIRLRAPSAAPSWEG